MLKRAAFVLFLMVLPATSANEPATWWCFRPLVKPLLPTVKTAGWVRSPIDAFILQKLEAAGLKPSPEPDRLTLIRRLTYDLHGLPPTSEEINLFLSDSSPHAYEKLVDRLLASPRYGERWGRHWLDVVHYGDTHGYDKDKRRNNAWPYRDYVIRSLNDDKPYERFVREQLAGDALFPNDKNGVTATGFIAAGPWDFVGHIELREGTVDKEKTRLIDRDDMLSNAMSTFVSLTVHCARCHDHKFDPITQKDYYRLQAVFAGVDRGDRPIIDSELAKKRHELEIDHKRLADERKAIPVANASAIEAMNQRIATVEKELKGLPPLQYVFTAVTHPPRPIHILTRGDVEKPGEHSVPGSLACVSSLPPDFNLSNPDVEGTRRAALAEWIVHRDNPLTWRSIVNRVWHFHFGKGIVDTPNDFGKNGGLPSHLELLDWLAVEFRDGGQSLKKLHRLIVTSATYRQSSRPNAAFARIDADNRLLWRMNRQRLDAESIRDATLSVSGKLDMRMGGPGFDLFRFRDDHSPEYDHSAIEKINSPETYRRTVYRFVVRSVPNPFLDCLDCADPNINTPVRNTTLTALQALALLNDPFMVKQSEFFAERLMKATSVPAKRIEIAYELAFGRSPNADEMTALLGYAKKHGLANTCRVLYNANEFVFVD